MRPTCWLWLLLVPLGGEERALDARALRADVEHLASDELGGREAGTEDALRAARFLAERLEAAGVHPAGDSFLLPVPLERQVHGAPPALAVTLRDGTRVGARFGEDFDLYVRGEARSTGPLTLRTVRSLEELPAEANAGDALWLDADRAERGAWLEARGMGEGEGWGLLVRPGSRRPGRPAHAPRTRLRLAPEEHEPEADAGDVVRLRGALREHLEAGEIAALELRYDVRRETLVDHNVVGVLRGAGTEARPELAREVVIFSAHYDHLGRRPADPADPEADTVFNGADDDASGTAAVLALARAFGGGPAPARTLLFFLAAGEEQGLLGTRHYLEHPALPLADTVCDLNFEMIGRPDELAGGPGVLWLTGFERSNLGAAFQGAGLRVEPDRRPEQGFFRRSDNFPLARLGIVAQTLSSFGLHEDYHRPSDEARTLDWEHLEAVAQSALAAARLLASGELDPAWLPGGNPAGE